MNDAFGGIIFWTILVLLLAVLGWSLLKISRQRSAARRAAESAWTRPEDYRDHHRVVWDENPETFAPRQLHWPLGVAALMGICGGDPWDRLALVKVDDARSGVREAWGLRSRGQLLNQLYWLLREGHRVSVSAQIDEWNSLDDAAATELGARFRAAGTSEALEDAWRLEQVRANARDIRDVSFEAWDLVRAAMLSRAGYSIGWLSEQEAVDTLNLVSTHLQAGYAGWTELGEAFTVARWYWEAHSGLEAKRDAAHDASLRQALLDPATGPWAKLPWRQQIPPARLLLADALVDEELLTDPPLGPPTELGAILDEAIVERLRQRA